MLDYTTVCITLVKPSYQKLAKKGNKLSDALGLPFVYHGLAHCAVYLKNYRQTTRVFENLEKARK